MVARRIGLFLVSDRTGYQRLLADAGRRAAKQARLDLEVFSADDTAAQQSAQIVRFLHAHPDEELAVIAMPVHDIGHEVPLRNLARRVLARGCPWILLNRDVEAHVREMRAEFPDVPAACVLVDNHEVGRIQGRQAAALTAGRPAVMLHVLGNMHTTAARDRRAGTVETLPKSVAVCEVEGMWSGDAAEKAVARWLATSVPAQGVQVVACQNDPMAVGARRALHRAALEARRPEWASVPVLGADGVPDEGQRLVDERLLAATVVMPPSAGAAVDLVARAWTSGAPLPERLVLPPSPYPAR